MAAGETIQGVRFPATTSLDDLYSADDEPIVGAYFVTEDRRAVWMVLPTRMLARLSTSPAEEPAWGLTEHDDGTISLAPSILCHPSPNVPGWHGYLERGIWREV